IEPADEEMIAGSVRPDEVDPSRRGPGDEGTIGRPPGPPDVHSIGGQSPPIGTRAVHHEQLRASFSDISDMRDSGAIGRPVGIEPLAGPLNADVVSLSPLDRLDPDCT